MIIATNAVVIIFFVFLTNQFICIVQFRSWNIKTFIKSRFFSIFDHLFFLPVINIFIRRINGITRQFFFIVFRFSRIFVFLFHISMIVEIFGSVKNYFDNN